MPIRTMEIRSFLKFFNWIRIAVLISSITFIFNRSHNHVNWAPLKRQLWISLLDLYPHIMLRRKRFLHVKTWKWIRSKRLFYFKGRFRVSIAWQMCIIMQLAMFNNVRFTVFRICLFFQIFFGRILENKASKM